MMEEVYITIQFFTLADLQHSMYKKIARDDMYVHIPMHDDKFNN